MCIWTMENNWGQLKGQLKRDDILVISTLKELSDMHSGIREKLQYCKESGVRICLKGICLQAVSYTHLSDHNRQSGWNRKRKSRHHVDTTDRERYYCNSEGEEGKR